MANRRWWAWFAGGLLAGIVFGVGLSALAMVSDVAAKRQAQLREEKVNWGEFRSIVEADEKAAAGWRKARLKAEKERDRAEQALREARQKHE